MRLKGPWVASVEYVNDGNYIDLVTSNGSIYACKKNNTNKSVSDTTYWELIAKKGDTGPKGDGTNIVIQNEQPQGNIKDRIWIQIIS